MRIVWTFVRIGSCCVAFAICQQSPATPPTAWYGYDYAPGEVGTITQVPPPAAPAGSPSFDLEISGPTPSSVTSPVPAGLSTNQAFQPFQQVQSGSNWIRFQFATPASSFDVSEGGPNNAPYGLVQDNGAPASAARVGSEFSSTLTYGYGPYPFAGQLAPIPIPGTARPALEQPIRGGIVLPPSAPPGQAVWANSAISDWASVSDSSIVPPAGFFNSELGIFTLQSASPEEGTVRFENLFIPVGGLFYSYSASFPPPTTTTAFGSVQDGDPWVIFESDVSLGVGATYSVPSGGTAGVFDFMGNLTVPAGSAVYNSDIPTPPSAPTNINTSFVIGASNIFTGPGIMELGQLNIQSQNWRLVNAFVRARPGGPTSVASAILFPGSTTTVDSQSTLWVDNSLEIRTGATLRGLGLVQGPTVNSAGRIAPGDGAQLGTLTFASSTVLTCSSSAIGASEIYTPVTPVAHARLTLNSPPTLGGALVVPILRSPGAYQEGDRFVVLSAPSFNGSFATVQAPGAGPISAFLSASLESDPTSYYVLISRYRDYLSTACLPNDRRVAAALDLARTTGCQSLDLMEGLSLTLDQLPLSAFDCPCIWQQISGMEILGLAQSAATTADQLARATQWELWHAQDGWAQSASFPLQTRLWADGSYGQTSWSSGEEAFHLQSQGGYGLVGAEASSQNWVGGLTAHYAPFRQNWHGLASTGHLWLVGGGLYGGWSQPDRWWIEGGSWYATASGSWDYLGGQLERTSLQAGPWLEGTCQECVQSSPSGMATWGRLEGGYRWNGPILVQPYLAWQGAWARIDAFCEEAGFSSLPLRYQDSTGSESWLSPGLRLQVLWESPRGHLISPEVVVEINQSLGSRHRNGWVGFQGSPFLIELEGAPLPPTTLFLSGGLQLVWNRWIAAQLRANLQKGAHFEASGVDVQLSISF